MLHLASDTLTALDALAAADWDGAASADQAAAMASFPGWGPLAALFQDFDAETPTDLAEAARAVQEKLGPAAVNSARRATFSAYYTPAWLSGAMVALLQRLGTGDTAAVLEPGCGHGAFLGAALPNWKVTGVELDLTAARIASLRFPQHRVVQDDFLRWKVDGQPFDAAIGNVPFADIDVRYDGASLSLHDAFILRTLDLVRPGGIVALITSRFTLDKQNDGARRLMAARAELVEAWRLPDDVFADLGVRMPTDLLVFRVGGQGADDWLATTTVDLDGHKITLNERVAQTGAVGGKLTARSGRYGTAELHVQPNPESRAEVLAAIRRCRELPPLVPSGFVHVTGQEEAGRDARIDIDEEGWFWLRTAGKTERLMRGGKQLRRGSGKVAQRLEALCGLRDLARACLDVQLSGADNDTRQRIRADLAMGWQAFVARFGFINKTTVSVSENGAATHRRPNLEGFWQDADVALVMALEDYDDETHTATPAAIMRGDVVGPTVAPAAPRNATEALAQCLDRCGRVDMAAMAAALGKTESEAEVELGDLVYLDPQSWRWVTADDYLSGNVRRKLAEAEQAASTDPRFTRNADALRAVQPEDLLPGEIAVHLGAAWVPASDVHAFVVHLLQVQDAKDVSVGYSPIDGAWTISAGGTTRRSLPATNDFGTSRVNAIDLLESILNLQPVVVHDEVTEPDGSKRRIVNDDETLAAKAKASEVVARFDQWIFADVERATRLVRIYNDRFNATRLRAFDGSHLRFDGMSLAITLAPHQRNAVWRIIAAGNTLLHHPVGSGKSFTMIAAAMKKREMGLARKAVIAVPLAVLGQFVRQAKTLYPLARILVASAEDFGRTTREAMNARLAFGDFDLAIISHSALERIPLDPAIEADIRDDLLASYADALRAAEATADGIGGARLVRHLAKKIERLRLRIDELREAKPKDGVVTFDRLGVDFLLVDEAHAFKRLDLATRMRNVKGIADGGSQRAMDLLTKVTWLNQRSGYRGTVFATATPISNTLGEIYVFLRMLAPHQLEAKGLNCFDQWASVFGKVVESMEVAADGRTLRPVARFARFVNLPELVADWRRVADVLTQEQLNLPRPALAGGKAQIVAVPMTPWQRTYQDTLVERYERVRGRVVSAKDDNALAILGEGRKLAIDGRLLDASADAGAKLAAVARNVLARYEQTQAFRGTQLIMLDIGVHPHNGFAAYDELIRLLVAAGVPRAEVATMREADTDAKKQAIFAKVRKGAIRVLIGSTERLGTGANVQDRLAALHHVDAPWRPSDVEQREGRILRWGNRLQEVEILRYVTESTFDAFVWGLLSVKAGFVGTVLASTVVGRSAEDVGEIELDFHQVKAIASGNPAMVTLAKLDAEAQRLAGLARSFDKARFRLRCRHDDLGGEIERLTRSLPSIDADVAAAERGHDELRIEGRTVDAKEASKVFGRAWLSALRYGRRHSFARIGAFEVVARIDRAEGDVVEIVGPGGRPRAWSCTRTDDAQGLLGM
ncbi:MAG: hypothetical protein EA356_14625, partial [Geminicoccaceae bacterium]